MCSLMFFDASQCEVRISKPPLLTLALFENADQCSVDSNTMSITPAGSPRKHTNRKECKAASNGTALLIDSLSIVSLLDTPMERSTS